MKPTPEVKAWLARIESNIDQLRVERAALLKLCNSPEVRGVTVAQLKAAVRKAIAERKG